jgi:hypothetical protein
MAGYVLDLSGESVVESKSGLIPAGTRQATVYNAEVEQYENGNNKGRPKLRLQFKIAEGEPDAGRVLFHDFGLFPAWAPTDKSPEGAYNFAFFQFYSAILGKEEKEFHEEVKAAKSGKGKLTLPDLHELLGKQVTVKVGIEFNEYRFNKAVAEGDATEEDREKDEFKRNVVKEVRAPKKGGAAAGKAKVTRL